MSRLQFNSQSDLFNAHDELSDPKTGERPKADERATGPESAHRSRRRKLQSSAAPEAAQSLRRIVETPTSLPETDGHPEHGTAEPHKAEPVAEPVNAALAEDPTIDSARTVVRMPPTAPAFEERFLSDLEVAKRYGVSRPTVWRWCKTNPNFPGPKEVSPGTTRWLLSHLRAFEARMPDKLKRDPTGSNS